MAAKKRSVSMEKELWDHVDACAIPAPFYRKYSRYIQHLIEQDVAKHAKPISSGISHAPQVRHALRRAGVGRRSHRKPRKPEDHKPAQ